MIDIDKGKVTTYQVKKTFPCGTFINRWNLNEEFAEEIDKCKTYEEYQALCKGEKQ